MIKGFVFACTDILLIGFFECSLHVYRIYHVLRILWKVRQYLSLIIPLGSWKRERKPHFSLLGSPKMVEVVWKGGGGDKQQIISVVEDFINLQKIWSLEWKYEFSTKIHFFLTIFQDSLLKEFRMTMSIEFSILNLSKILEFSLNYECS